MALINESGTLLSWMVIWSKIRIGVGAGQREKAGCSMKKHEQVS